MVLRGRTIRCAWRVAGEGVLPGTARGFCRTPGCAPALASAEGVLRRPSIMCDNAERTARQVKGHVAEHRASQNVRVRAGLGVEPERSKHVPAQLRIDESGWARADERERMGEDGGRQRMGEDGQGRARAVRQDGAGEYCRHARAHHALMVP